MASPIQARSFDYISILYYRNQDFSWFGSQGLRWNEIDRKWRRKPLKRLDSDAERQSLRLVGGNMSRTRITDKLKEGRRGN